DIRLELLEPTDPTSPVAAFLEKRGEGLHHVAYTVEGINDRIAELKRAGLRMIDDVPRPGAHHMNIAFVHPKSSCGVLTELCEPAGAPGPNCPRTGEKATDGRQVPVPRPAPQRSGRTHPARGHGRLQRLPPRRCGQGGPPGAGRPGPAGARRRAAV